MSTVAAHPVVWRIHHSCPLKKDKQLNMFLFKKLIQSKKHMFQSLRHSLQMLLMLMEIWAQASKHGSTMNCWDSTMSLRRRVGTFFSNSNKQTTGIIKHPDMLVQPNSSKFLLIVPQLQILTHPALNPHAATGMFPWYLSPAVQLANQVNVLLVCRLVVAAAYHWLVGAYFGSVLCLSVHIDCAYSFASMMWQYGVIHFSGDQCPGTSTTYPSVSNFMQLPTKLSPNGDQVAKAAMMTAEGALNFMRSTVSGQPGSQSK